MPRVIDPKARAAIRALGFCEVCGRSDLPLHCAHLLARGMGGGKCVDDPINLVCLCWECHGLNHAGKLSFDKLAGIVVKREVWKILQERT